MADDLLSGLMTQVAAGDANAFRHLTQKIGQRLFNIAFRLMGGQRELAEDAVQEALIKLWRTAPQWEPKAPVEAYAARLVYTCCMDQHRKRKNWTELPEEIPMAETILEELIARQEHIALSRAIDQLPERSRQAVLYSYMNEFSQKHIAHLMGTTEKAVERLIARARDQLRRILLTAQHDALKHQGRAS